MIQWVYEAAQTAELLDRTIIATDDERILKTAESFGADAILTSPAHHSGTERIAEIAESTEFPLAINIQGDEPLLKGAMVDSLVEELQDETLPMATLARKVRNLSLLPDKNIVKVVMDNRGYALYFSRSPLPFQAADYFWEHIGIYGYQKNFLIKFRQLSPSRLENTEKLEQLRALENGFRVKVVETTCPTLSVDVPADITKVEKMLEKGSL